MRSEHRSPKSAFKIGLVVAALALPLTAGVASATAAPSAAQHGEHRGVAIKVIEPAVGQVVTDPLRVPTRRGIRRHAAP